MANIALREMIRALRSENPGIGLKKLTAQIKAFLPEDMVVEKKTVREVYQGLDDQHQPATQIRARDDNFHSRIKAAFEMFRDAERAYLLAFDNEKVRSITKDPDAPGWYAASQLRHYFEIFLTLKGKKPCTLAGMNAGEELINGMVLQCLAPMMEQFELESYGFTLRYLAHDVLTEQLGHPGFKNSWIFADKQSEKWNSVEDIFLLPHPGQRNREDAIGAALGYPLPGGETTVWLIDETETSELQRITGEEVDEVIGMEFFCIDGNVGHRVRLHEYYAQCKQAAKDVGVQLKIDDED
ncbi:hypothetical protein F4820DRAFT_110632 [Hypoxylon rubiginosum]|uniref:Uncharacterized protein n=1 Tax=Hypoxylon rubiginosum TaxID=110542 RepID=A0ACB9YLV1_9PEZI|nr:hypothetical protein F4820DRAFT_110632 [Hypoxylon rubiginosum]